MTVRRSRDPAGATRLRGFQVDVRDMTQRARGLIASSGADEATKAAVNALAGAIELPDEHSQTPRDPDAEVGLP